MTNNLNNKLSEQTIKGNQPLELSITIDKALNNNNKSTLKLEERPDINGLKYILQLDEATYQKKYMKKVDVDGKKPFSLKSIKAWAQKHLDNEVDGTVTIPVVYEAGDDKPKGRLYASDGINIQYLSKHLRGILLGKNYKDIDIANCWFSIALLICEDYNRFRPDVIEFPSLYHYVKNRDDVFKKMRIPKAEGKELFNRVWNTDSYLVEINDDFLCEFYHEKAKIIKTIINDSEYISKYDDIDIIRKSAEYKKQNQLSSQMWYLISIIETAVVREKIKDCNEGTYLYDGAMILKGSPFEPTAQDGISWVEKPIPICPLFLKWKPMDVYLEKVYNAVHGSLNIKSATFDIIADWLLSIVGNKFAYCDKSVYRCNKYNVWETVDNGDGDVQQLLSKHIKPLVLTEQAKAKAKILEDPEDKGAKFIVKKWNIIIDYLCGDAGWPSFRNILIGKSKMKNAKFPEKLDLLKEHICFSNKKYDLKTKKWSDILPQDYISITTGYNYEEPNEKETNMLNEMYLNKIFVNKGDRGHFMKSMCACLDGLNRRRKMNVFTNSGSNGKSVICDLLKHALGEYHNSAPSSLIQRTKAASGSANPELFRFKNCRMIQMNEPDKGEKMNSAFIKELTGGDTLSARQLHSNQIVQFRPTASLCLLANDMPPLDCKDPASLGRMNIIPFESTFRSDITKDDWENKEFVADDRVLENYDKVKNAFFNEIVSYYSQYLSNTNWIYKSELGEEYMDSQDFVKQFLDTYTEKVPNSAKRVNVNELYELMKIDDTLKEHCPSSQRKFNRILRSKGMEIEKTHGNQVIRGFKLKSSENAMEIIEDDLDL